MIRCATSFCATLYMTCGTSPHVEVGCDHHWCYSEKWLSAGLNGEGNALALCDPGFVLAGRTFGPGALAPSLTRSLPRSRTH